MGSDIFELSINFIKMAVIFLFMVQMVPLLVWVERRGSAFIQNRLGPNRVGPLGLLQLLADAVKFIFKEEFIPEKGKKFLFYLAPILALIPAGLAFNAIPLSQSMHIESFHWLGRKWGPYDFLFQGYHFDLGVVFVLAVSSLAVYSLLLAGWSSGNKYSLLGALRASAQTISYELGLSLSLVGILLIYGTFNFTEMINLQKGPLSFQLLGEAYTLNFLPNWGIFYQPLGALLFFISMFAETNRLPFDLPEAESELVAGYHTEYGGMKMLMFYMGEYGHMLVASALMSLFYFGGYQIPFVEEDHIRAFLASFSLSTNGITLMTSFLYFLVFFLKILVFLWIFIWVRWTIPRFRYDQLMDLGWKGILPWALFNTLLTACILVLMR